MKQVIMPLKEYLEKDLFNELRWLLCAATQWDAYEKLIGEPPQVPKIKEPCFHLKVYTMDSALLHARSLYEFFTATKFREGRLTWRDYGISACQKSATYCKFMKPLHGRVMHLDKDRSDYEEIKKEVVTLAGDILSLWEGFTGKPDLMQYQGLLKTTRQKAIEEARRVAGQYGDLGYKCPF